MFCAHRSSRSRASRLALAAAAVLLTVAPTAASGDDFAGGFEGEGLYLELELDEGIYMGAIQMGDQLFLCRAQRRGSGLVGTFETEDGEYPFELSPAGTGLVLTSGGATYTLRRVGEAEQGAGNPLAGGASENPLAGGGLAPGSPAAPSLAGRYHGSIQGTPATVTLKLEGSRLSGQIDASGYLYTVEGSSAGDRASGRCSDPQTGGTFGCEVSVQGDDLELVLVVEDPYTGQQQRVPLSFRRQGASAPPGGSPGDLGSGQTAPGRAEVPAGQRDPALVGVWRHSESMTSGDASMVIESFLTINGDGTFAVGGGRAVGGGAGWGGDTGGGGVEERGYWKSENRIVYIQAPGTGQWQPFARYYVEPQKLMFTFGDGSRQILSRVR